MANKLSKIGVAVIGGTGYAGQQLVELLLKHPKVKLKKLVSKSTVGKLYSTVCPKFTGQVDMVCESFESLIDDIKSIDLVILSVPHGQSKDLVKCLSRFPLKIIDLGGDFRLSNLDDSLALYGNEYKELLNKFTYGLCELNKDAISSSDYVASPGCYATAMQLALLPLKDKEVISIVVDGKSGISGAGKSLKSDLLYSEAGHNLKAYGVTGHRHKYEVTMTMGHDLVFVPHLIPMYKGILCSVYVKLEEIYDEDYYKALYDDFYKSSIFVRVKDELTEVKHVIGSNYCDLAIRLDKENKTLMIFSCIDNLMKGAAGQGIQNMNIMYGFDERTGL